MSYGGLERQGRVRATCVPGREHMPGAWCDVSHSCPSLPWLPVLSGPMALLLI